MPIPLDAPEVLTREYLEIRAMLLSVAAKLDRIDRAAANAPVGPSEPRLAQIQQGLDILKSAQSDRAERIQRLFSLPYLENWKADFQLT